MDMWRWLSLAALGVALLTLPALGQRRGGGGGFAGHAGFSGGHAMVGGRGPVMTGHSFGFSGGFRGGPHFGSGFGRPGFGRPALVDLVDRRSLITAISSGLGLTLVITAIRIGITVTIGITATILMPPITIRIIRRRIIQARMATTGYRRILIGWKMKSIACVRNAKPANRLRRNRDQSLTPIRPNWFSATSMSRKCRTTRLWDRHYGY